MIATGTRSATSCPKALRLGRLTVNVAGAHCCALRSALPPLNLQSHRLIGVAFFENVIDRLGFIGPPGAPGVSWGDFQHFIAYTAQVNAFAPAAIVPALAVLATIAEGTFGVTMLLGVRVWLASVGSALLLFTFATAMVLSGLSQFQYGVYLMSIAAWALATVDASALSVDSLFGIPSASAA